MSRNLFFALLISIFMTGTIVVQANDLPMTVTCSDETGVSFTLGLDTSWSNDCQSDPNRSAERIMYLVPQNAETNVLEYTAITALSYSPDLQVLHDHSVIGPWLDGTIWIGPTFYDFRLDGNGPRALVEVDQQIANAELGVLPECHVYMYIDTRETGQEKIYQFRLSLGGPTCDPSKFAASNFVESTAGWTLSGEFNGIEFSVYIPKV